MLESLKFVQGSVAKKDLVPALTHFLIENGTVRGYNGMLGLCSPIPFDIECKPKAESLVRAIANCSDTVQLAMTPGGRLSVKSGNFKAFVDCLPDDSTPHVQPEGEFIEVDGDAMLRAFKAVSPFIGDDASRPWSNGVLLLGQSAFATNNIILVEYWTGFSVPQPMNIPRAAIKELLRIDTAPSKIQLTETSITFHFTEERWLRTQLFETKWPDLNKVLARESSPVPLDPRLFEALLTLKPFADKSGQILFKGEGKVATHDADSEGATYTIAGFDHVGSYHISMLSLLKDNVTSIDWSSYPAPAMFFGDRMRGAIVGMRI